MLDGSELSIAITAVIAGAVCVGFLLHWVWTAMGHRPGDLEVRLEEMSARLHEEELAREAAEIACQEATALAARHEADAARRLADLGAQLEAAVAARDHERDSDLAEARADLAALRDGLGAARRRISELEAEAEALRAGMRR